MRNSGVSALNTAEVYSPELKRGHLSTVGNKKGDLIPLNYDTVSDEVLVELYQIKRDELALSNIIKRYKDTMFGFAVKMTKNHSDAEDIVQEISLILVKKLDSFKGDSKFSTWLYKVTLNACYMLLNKTKKTSTYEIKTEHLCNYAHSSHSSSGKWAENPSRVTLYKETSGIVERALSELSSQNKEIVRLKDIEGYSNAEVGEIMGISIPAVKSRLLRSRLVLRKKLKNYFKDIN